MPRHGYVRGRPLNKRICTTIHIEQENLKKLEEAQRHLMMHFEESLSRSDAADYLIQVGFEILKRANFDPKEALARPKSIAKSRAKSRAKK